jgi:DDE superfamily endonuclease
MVPWKLPAEFVAWVERLSTPLHRRLAWRLLPLLTGLLFAVGRRTVASWLRAIAAGKGFKPYYYFLSAVGRKAGYVASLLLRLVVERIESGRDYELFALDDTPTKRYGPLVEGAGIHHNPTPGPADQEFLYGHIWVTLSWVVQHPWWGVIGLPLRSLLYIRQKDVAKLPRWYGVKFRTKLQMAVELVHWLADWLKYRGKRLWLVADGAYAKRELLQAVRAVGMTLVSRLRKDAALHDVPPPRKPGMPGRPRKYGSRSISLAKRAGHARGWQRDKFELYGKVVTKTYKTFLATWRPAGGVIRVVLVREDNGWIAFFCTDVQATVTQILGAVAERSAIEQDFKDLKEVHGAGQPQVRNLWANVGAWHLALWLHTLVELWAWDRTAGQLCARRQQSPWDDMSRRPSHADRCNALRQLCVRQEFQSAGRRRPLTRKLRQLTQHLLRLVV